MGLKVIFSFHHPSKFSLSNIIFTKKSVGIFCLHHHKYKSLDFATLTVLGRLSKTNKFLVVRHSKLITYFVQLKSKHSSWAFCFQTHDV